MSIETQEREIGDHLYQVQQFPAGRSFELLWEWKDVLGPSVGVFAGGAIENAIMGLGAGKSGAQVLNLITRSLEFTFIAGQAINEKAFFDDHFAGKLGHLCRVIAFMLEVNYYDFFVEIREAIFSGLTQIDNAAQEIRSQLSTYQDILKPDGQSSASRPKESPTSS